MYYDLHIHSCLSPCANDDMTPNNIVNMAIIKGLDLISVCDHNTLLQQKVIKKIALEKGIQYIYGVEVSTKEDVHCLCYFKDDVAIDAFQAYIDEHLIIIKNKKEYFGNQLLMNEHDEVVGEIENLLLSSLNVSIEALALKVKALNGIFIPAHIDAKKNSILHHLGFIPKSLVYDGLEIKYAIEDLKMFNLKDVLYLRNSDAHQLIDIQEAINEISKEEYEAMFI